MFIDFREKGEKLDPLPLVHAPTRDWTYNLVMYPDLESNLQPFGVWDDSPTEPPSQGGFFVFKLLGVRNIMAIDFGD